MRRSFARLTLSLCRLLFVVSARPDTTLRLSWLLNSRPGESAIGWLCSTGFNSPLRGLGRRALGGRLTREPLTRQVLLDQKTLPESTQLLELAADPDLGPLVMRRTTGHRADSGLRDTVCHVIVQAPFEAGAAQLLAAFQLLPSVAATLSDDNAKAILRSLAVRAEQPIDPYGDSRLTTSARTAFVELLVRRPELDEQVTDILLSGERDSGRVETIASLLGAAIRTRAPEGGRAFARALQRWAPKAEAAESFARAADNLTPAASEQPFLPGPWRGHLESIRTGLAAAAEVLAGPLIAVSVGAWAYRYKWHSPTVIIGVADAVAALTVLATVNVFTVQLSATRLPGPIARVAGQSRWVGLAYSAVLTTMALTLSDPRSVRLSRATSWAALVTTAAVVFFLAASVLTFSRRTDPGRAAGAYRKSTNTRHRAAGRRLGRLQARAGEIRVRAADLDGVSLGIEVERTGRRVLLSAPRRGFLLPNMRRLRALSRSEPFRNGDVALRISKGIGTIVKEGALIASLVPTRSSTVGRVTWRRARRALCLRRVGRVDETTSAAVGLISLAFELDNRADAGTAAIVGQEAALLVASQVGAARESRRHELRRQQRHSARGVSRDAIRPEAELQAATERARDLTLVPVVPSLRAAIIAAVSGCGHSAESRSDLRESMLRVLLDCSQRAEAGAVMLAVALPQTIQATQPGFPPDVETITELLRMSAERAMETEDGQTLAFVRQRLLVLFEDSTGRPHTLAVASILGAMSCWLMPLIAREQLEWYLGIVTKYKVEGSTAALLGFCRIGAAALASGIPSVAFGAAGAVKAAHSDLDLVRQKVLEDGVWQREDTQSKLRGGYLGDSPPDALKSFVDFVGIAAASL
jgi:hypothetical protein